MSDHHIPPRRPRGLIWLIFYAPGAFILWWQYHFPRNAEEAWASARRKDNRTIQLLYSLGFWALLVLALVVLVMSGASNNH